MPRTALVNFSTSTSIHVTIGCIYVVLRCGLTIKQIKINVCNKVPTNLVPMNLHFDVKLIS